MSKETVKILVVDDEENIVKFLEMGLVAEGYEVYSADNGIEGVQIAKKIKPDIVILDIMMPGLNGYEACKEIKTSLDTIVIMLTARNDIDDRVKGLDTGADDYVIKPFSYRELVARIKARLRGKGKNENVKETILDSINGFSVNDDAHEIKYKGKRLELSPTEYKLLNYLLNNKGIVLSKAKILDNVWGYDFYGDENIVEVYIKYLRNKIEDVDYKTIQTVRGAGYKLNEGV